MMKANSYSINILFSEWDNQSKSVNVYIVFTDRCVHMENMRLAFTELVTFVSFLIITQKTSKVGIAMIFLFEFSEVQFHSYTQRDIRK